MAKTVVLLGKNQLITLGVLRSLAKAGYKVAVLSVAAHRGASGIIASSRYANSVVEVAGNDDGRIVDALMRKFLPDGEKGVLFPTDDYSALLIDRMRETLCSKYDMPHVIGASVAKLMDKSVQGALAKRSGLKTAAEWSISLDSDTIHIPDDVVFPCFVKPAVSALGAKSELQKCDTYPELEGQLYRMRSRLRARTVLVQEFLNIQDEYDIGGVCKDRQVYVPAIIKKNVVAKHNRGVTLKGTVVDRSELSEDMTRIIDFLTSVRFVGMFDLEVMATDRGLYFGELNLRCGGPSYSYFCCGVNLPSDAVQAILDREVDTGRSAARLGRSFYNNRTAWEDYVNGGLSKAELREIYRSCDFSLYSDSDDPVPERIYNMIERPRYFLKSRLKRMMRR